jgi:ABC-type antimicrobial peptide transport system permease subunit
MTQVIGRSPDKPRVGSADAASGMLRWPYPVRSVLRRWKSLLGMMLGVGIALGIGMLMLGVSKASTELTTRDFQESGADMYVIARGGALVPVLPGDTPGTIDHARQTLGLIRNSESVNSAIGTLSWTLERELPGPRRADTPTELIAVVGVDGDPTAIPGAIALSEGRWLSRADEVVAGARLAKELGWSLGDLVRLPGRDLRVVGIGRLRGSGIGGASLLYMSMESLRPRTGSGDIVNIIQVETTEPAQLRGVLDELESFTIFTREEAIEVGNAAYASDQIGQYLFIGLTLTIAALFVASMLGRSVARRRLDFATLRAIGIPNATILLIVAGEAILVVIPAGIIGVVLSSVMGSAINATLAPTFGLETMYTADARLIALVFALAIGLGLLAGFVPARHATRVDPVDVLREA